jgi:hypothetical protein
MAQNFPALDENQALSIVIPEVETKFDTIRSTFSGAVAPGSPVTGQLWYDTANAEVFVWNGATFVSVTASGAPADHGTLTGLADDDHAQYALLNGRSGGQTLIGGTAAGNNLTLRSTSNATVGEVRITHGSDFVVYSDNASTKTFDIDGATGATTITTQSTVLGLDVYAAGNTAARFRSEQAITVSLGKTSAQAATDTLLGLFDGGTTLARLYANGNALFTGQVFGATTSAGTLDLRGTSNATPGPVRVVASTGFFVYTDAGTTAGPVTCSTLNAATVTASGTVSGSAVTATTVTASTSVISPTIIGTTTAAGNLDLRGTSNATPGPVRVVHSTGLEVYTGAGTTRGPVTAGNLDIRLATGSTPTILARVGTSQTDADTTLFSAQNQAGTGVFNVNGLGDCRVTGILYGSNVAGENLDIASTSNGTRGDSRVLFSNNLRVFSDNATTPAPIQAANIATSGTARTVVGPGATATADNQVVLGTSAETVIVPGTFRVVGFPETTGIIVNPATGTIAYLDTGDTFTVRNVITDDVLFSVGAFGALDSVGPVKFEIPALLSAEIELTGTDSEFLVTDGANTLFGVADTGGISIGGGLRFDGDGFLLPVSSADASAPNNSIYYSTDSAKLVYKDGGGGVNDLY